MLQQQMMQPFQGMQQAHAEHAPRHGRACARCSSDLNQMLREKAEGGEPDFQGFMDKWGQFFPASRPGPADRADAAQGAMQSHAQHVPSQRRQLEEMMQPLLQDERAGSAAERAGDEPRAAPPDGRHARRYPFRGDEPLSLQEAMQLMDDLQEMDRPRAPAPRRARRSADLDRVDGELLARLLGDEAAEDLEQLKQLTKMLEDAGYLERKGDELAAHAARHPQDRPEGAARHLRRASSATASAATRPTTAAPAATAPTRPRPTSLAIRSCSTSSETVMNAVERRGPGTPLRLRPDDFEVYRTELRTQAPRS